MLLRRHWGAAAAETAGSSLFVLFGVLPLPPFRGTAGVLQACASLCPMLYCFASAAETALQQQFGAMVVYATPLLTDITINVW